MQWTTVSCAICGSFGLSLVLDIGTLMFDDFAKIARSGVRDANAAAFLNHAQPRAKRGKAHE